MQIAHVMTTDCDRRRRAEISGPFRRWFKSTVAEHISPRSCANLTRSVRLAHNVKPSAKVIGRSLYDEIPCSRRICRTELSEGPTQKHDELIWQAKRSRKTDGDVHPRRNYVYSGSRNYYFHAFRLGKRSRCHARCQSSHACELEDSGNRPGVRPYRCSPQPNSVPPRRPQHLLDNNRVETSGSKAVAS